MHELLIVMYLCCKQFIYWLYKPARINLVVHVYHINEVSNMYGISIDPGTLCPIKRDISSVVDNNIAFKL
jgi:hypothetical protein